MIDYILRYITYSSYTMKIDTLVLSGGGPSGIAYPTIFKALYEHEILTPELSEIREMIVTSAGIIMAYCLLLQMDNHAIHEFIQRFDMSSSLQLEDISIDGLLFEGGLFETSAVKNIIRSLTRHILHKDDITLHELYLHNPITLTVKVFNITNKVYEFISHHTHPTMSIITLAQITTAIPVLFKPIVYEGHTYCDGGIRSGYPYGHLPSPHYLGIKLNMKPVYLSDAKTSPNQDKESHHLLGEIPLIHNILHIIQGEEDTHPFDPRIIEARVNAGSEFHMSEDKKQMIFKNTYKRTIDHIQTHFQSHFQD